MGATTVYLISQDAILDKTTGNYKDSYTSANITWGTGGVPTGTNLSLIGKATYIPIAAANITVTLTREPTILPIPVFGISAAIDYNVRRTIISLEGIVMATGTGGQSILGSIKSGTFGLQSDTKGWVVDGEPVYAGSSPDLNQKETQRALFARAVGLSMRETGGIYPLINRIVWGNPSLSTTPDQTLLTSGGTGLDGQIGDYSTVLWANVLVTKATIKEVGGEPTKYEGTLELQTVGFGASSSPFA